MKYCNGYCYKGEEEVPVIKKILVFLLKLLLVATIGMILSINDFDLPSDHGSSIETQSINNENTYIFR